MKLKRLEQLLTTSSLDKETKLQIIDLFAAINDPKQQEAFLEFLYTWDEGRRVASRELIEGISQANDTYIHGQQTSMRQAHRETLHVAHSLNHESKLAQLRANIEAL